VDKETKAEAIPRRFEAAFPFHEGMASVRIRGRYGFIDETGAVVIEPRFDMVGNFYVGLAEVVAGNKAGVIDRQGNFVVAPQFSRAIPFTKDVILAREAGEPSQDFEFGRLPSPVLDRLFQRSRFGLYAIGKGWLTKPDFYVEPFEKEGRGLIWATTKDRFMGPFGLLRADGTWQVEPQYTEAWALSDERARVVIPNRDDPDGPGTLDGAVDPDGKLVVPFRPWLLYHYVNGLGLVADGGKLTRSGKAYGSNKSGLIDKAGNLIGGRMFDRVVRAEKGDISRVSLDGKWAGLDREGRIVADPDEGKVLFQCPDFKLVWQSGTVHIVGPDNQPTAPFVLEEASIIKYLEKRNCKPPNLRRID
jgi:hypothetical protein